MKQRFLLFFAIIFLTHYSINGQTKPETAHLENMYSGTWVNKKTKRYLQFSFDKEVDYITINEWTGSLDKSKSETLDAYKAYIHGEKLIMPAENGDHHSHYCEISIANKKLVYACNGNLNFTDNQLVKDKYATQTLFKKLKE